MGFTNSPPPLGLSPVVLLSGAVMEFVKPNIRAAIDNLQYVDEQLHLMGTNEDFALSPHEREDWRMFCQQLRFVGKYAEALEQLLYLRNKVLE